MLQKIIKIQDHGAASHRVKDSTQKPQSNKRLHVIYADIANNISSRFIYLKYKLHISDEFGKQLSDLAPKIILNVIISMCINSDGDQATGLAMPFILWTTARGNVLRIVINVITLIVRYGINRYPNLISTDIKKESKIFKNNLSEESISISTESEVFQKDGQIPKFNSETRVTAEDISNLITSVMVNILIGHVRTTSVSVGTIAQKVMKSQNNKLVGDILQFLSEPEQRQITSEIKRDFACIKKCATVSKTTLRSKIEK
jgi:hypothetical protein